MMLILFNNIKGDMRMFSPKLFKVEDFNALIDFLRKNPFATVISSKDDVPYATQVPVMVDVIDEEVVLSFHLVRPNPQNKTLEQNKNVLIQSYDKSMLYLYLNQIQQQIRIEMK